MELLLLGPVQAVVAGRPISLGVRRERFVLATLALDVNKPVAVERLVGLLWPIDPPDSARAIIYSCISRLRARLAGIEVSLERQGAAYILRCDPECIDVHRFRHLVARAQNSQDDSLRVSLLGQALALWRGPALAGTAADQARARLCADLEEARVSAFEDRVEARLRLGHSQDVIEELLVASGEHPRRPRIVGALMQALHNAGRTADALRLYQEVRRKLREEFGLDPPTSLVNVHLAILRAAPQAGHAPTLGAWPVRPAQLPADLPSFTGRTHELDRLLTLFPSRAPTTVVITAIDGMAGIGKTVLAVHAAHHLTSSFPDGQIFVDLHGFTPGVTPRTPSAVLERLLRDLGVGGAQIPHGLEERSALWRSLLSRRRVLIVLDNAADETQVRPLLPGSAGCLVMVTSRRRLTGLDDAHQLTLDPMPDGDAFALFARITGHPRLDGPARTIIALCDGLPLAIRISGAWCRDRPTSVLTDLAQRLCSGHLQITDLAAGERTVAAALDVSCSRLQPAERRLFALLSVHPAGRFDAAAAAALAGTGLEQARRLLNGLLRVSIIDEPVPGRFQLHDLLRLHATQIFDREVPEPERSMARGRMLDHYTCTAGAAMDLIAPNEKGRRPRLPPPTTLPTPFTEAAAAAGWLQTELPTLLSCAELAVQGDRQDHASHLSTILWRYLDSHSHYADALHLHTLALESTRDRDVARQARALGHLGTVHWRLGGYDQAVEHLSQSLDLSRHVGDHAGEAEILIYLGAGYWRLGRYPEAMHHLQTALILTQKISDHVGEAYARTALSAIHLRQCRYAQAVTDAQRAVDLQRKAHNRVGEGVALNNLAVAYWRWGHHQQALQPLTQALSISREVGDRATEGHALDGLGYVYGQLGSPECAVRHLDHAITIQREIGNQAGEAAAIAHLGVIQGKMRHHELALQNLHQALALSRKTGERVLEAETLNWLGELTWETGQPRQAWPHLQGALALAQDLGNRLEQARAHRNLAYVHLDLADTERAYEHARAALTLFSDLDTPEAANLASDMRLKFHLEDR